MCAAQGQAMTVAEETGNYHSQHPAARSVSLDRQESGSEPTSSVDSYKWPRPSLIRPSPAQNLLAVALSSGVPGCRARHRRREPPHLYKSGKQGRSWHLSDARLPSAINNSRICKGSLKMSSGHLLVIPDVNCAATTCHLRHGVRSRWTLRCLTASRADLATSQAAAPRAAWFVCFISVCVDAGLTRVGASHRCLPKLPGEEPNATNPQSCSSRWHGLR